MFRYGVQQQLPPNYCLTVKRVTAEKRGNGSAADLDFSTVWIIDFPMREDGVTLQEASWRGWSFPSSAEADLSVVCTGVSHARALGA